MFFIKTLLVFISSLLSLSASAKTIYSDHVKVQLIAKDSKIEGTVRLGVYYQMDPEWHIYWKNPGDSGAAPKFNLEGGVIGEIHWPYPERIPVSDLTNYGYNGESVIFLDVQLSSNRPQLKLEWLVCKIDCIPGFGKFDIRRDVSLQPDVFDSFTAKLPQATNWSHRFLESSTELFRFQLSPPKGFEPSQFKNVFVFPKDGERFLSKTPGLQLDKKDLVLSVPVSKNSSTQVSELAEFTIVVDEKDKTTSFDLNVNPATSFQDFLWGMALAFIGGLLLNLMPCVFPVLFLKGFSFLKTESPAQIRRSSWIYTLGVLFSFLAIGGALTAFRLSGESLGWGFQLQNPYLVASLAVLFVLMGLNFLGVFHFFDSWGVSKSGKYFSGDFGTGVLAVVVASPCTAPFMGTALGLTLLLPVTQSLMVFLALGAGLAAPIPLLAHWPWLVHKLPRSGPWLETFKKLMALPLFATAAWLGWVLSLQVGGVDLSKDWAAYDEKVLIERRASQPVFVDFTASWCITCQVNKKAVLETEEIMNLFKENGVYLVRADWTNRDASITKALGRFQRNSVPLYVYYPGGDSEAKVLPELLSKKDIKELFIQGEKK